MVIATVTVCAYEYDYLEVFDDCGWERRFWWSTIAYHSTPSYMIPLQISS